MSARNKKVAQLREDAARFFGTEGRLFQVIYADPPWQYKPRTRVKLSEVAPSYPTMHLDDIKHMPVAGLAADDCYLLMWTTGPKMAESLEVMESWGFRYVTVFFTWVKTTSSGKERSCPGVYTLPSTEFCLLGIRGRSQHLKRDTTVRQLLVEPATGHSRKPDKSYERLDRFFQPGAKRIELFARRAMPGWEVWGNEVPAVNA